MSVVARGVIETTATILGPQSAAAKALAASEEYEDPVFYMADNSLYVFERSVLSSLPEVE